MKAAAEFSNEHEGENKQNTFKKHAGNVAERYYQNKRQKTEQKAIRGVFI